MVESEEVASRRPASMNNDSSLIGEEFLQLGEKLGFIELGEKLGFVELGKRRWEMGRVGCV